jgi:ABC-type branched-subunit amino acid transport system permease subunit
MNNKSLNLAFAIGFFILGLYNLYRMDLQEVCLYFLAALAFVFNILASEPTLLRYKKPFTIMTWVLMVVTGLLFLYLLQFKDL